ncbi:hypothetical protein P4679_22735 [Priestia megaterium]|uniref:hypothetical protein n=1 Tax=Priestia megaterium TaxID=1404 RepID=UPI002E1EE325|nr:hypothetical protein [Priestia megaterium]
MKNKEKELNGKLQEDFKILTAIQPMVNVENLELDCEYETGDTNDLKPEYRNIQFVLNEVDVKENKLFVTILEGDLKGRNRSFYGTQIKSSYTLRPSRNLKEDKVYGVISEKITFGDFLKHKRESFSSIQSDLMKYNGKSFDVICSLSSNKVDIEVAPMFKIQFQDGVLTDAYMDEIFKTTIFDGLIKDENLVRD